ncbi:MAG: hypothetical protein JWQ16_3311 [Novosphingobium sp.]|nr:hypothetical protein [Novosphingobium sp.]
MPYEPPPELGNLSLSEIAALVAERKLPPLDQWRPERTGDSEMRIAANGRWYHQGGEITRPAMVRAFATLLTRDAEGQHWLVTPQERLSIEVEDAALVAIDVVQMADTLTFRLNTDDLVIAGSDHSIRAAGDPDTPALYLTVPHGIEARLNRSTYLQLAEIALQGDGRSVASGGVTFSLTPA